MKVSIIVPVYNLENYIKKTLESIFHQTYKNWECILIDDGSTDKSAKIIRDVIANHSNVNFIQTVNRGVSSARNTGLEQSKGDYIYFVDGDDPLPLDALEILISAAESNNADIVIGKMMHSYKDELRNISTYERYGVYEEGEKTLEDNPEILHSIGPTAKLFHKNTIAGVRFPTNLKFAEEHPFIVKAYQNSRKIYVVNKLVYNYIIRDKKGGMSTTQQLDTRTYEFIENLMKSHMLVFKLMENTNSKKVKQYYYYRMTEYIMWPLLKTAVQSNNFSSYEKLFIQYFRSSAHVGMMERKTFKRVYISYCMRETNVSFYKKHEQYLKEVLQYSTKNWIELIIFNGEYTNSKYTIYNSIQKISYLTGRVKRKLQRLMRK